MKNKKMIVMISIFVVVLVAIVIGLILVFTGSKEQYRVIKVFEFDGDGVVTREDIGEVTPYINMLLESGDQVFFKSGNMTLKMDEDKYAYVEENTKFSINAEGTEDNSKTTINLMEGAITNEIQNPLSAESSYEVNTPNSTMAVRGTVFRVYVYYDENGTCYTKVSVFKGKVSTRLINPDGTVSEDELMIEEGKEVTIYQDDEVTDYVSDVSDIDYSELPDIVKDLIERILGSPIGDEEKETTENTTEENTTTTTEEQGTENGTTEQQRTEASSTEATTETPSTEEATTQEATTQEATTYTVTFMYEGAVFGTQTVNKGKKATIPSLMPSASGSWDFDFDTVITEDTIINWK